MRLRRFLMALAALATLAVPVSAHRGHDSISVVTIAVNGALTVSHRFEASDIEPALGEIAPGAQPSLDDPDAVKALVAYLGDQFTLSTERGRIRLTPGKVELTPSEVRIAFIGAAPAGARRLTVRSDVLGGIYSGQVNQVNVNAGSLHRTLAMAAGDSQTVALPARRR